MENYIENAEEFCLKYGVTIDKQYTCHRKYFPDDKDFRAVYLITIKRKNQKYVFEFGASINDSYIEKIDLTGKKYRKEKIQKPTNYDILSCIEKSYPMTHKEFCDEFGYNEDSIKDKKIYEKVLEQQIMVNRMFSDCLEELSEIQ